MKYHPPTQQNQQPSATIAKPAAEKHISAAANARPTKKATEERQLILKSFYDRTTPGSQRSTTHKKGDQVRFVGTASTMNGMVGTVSGSTPHGKLTVSYFDKGIKSKSVFPRYLASVAVGEESSTTAVGAEASAQNAAADKAKKSKKFKEAFNSTSKAIAPCTCGADQRRKQGLRKHDDSCALSQFRKTWAHAEQKVGVEAPTAAIKGMKALKPKPGLAPEHKHLQGAAGVDGVIVFASVGAGESGVRVAKRRKLSHSWVSIGNQCEVCRGYGKFVEGRSVSREIVPAWRAAISNMVEPRVAACSCAE
jgi:hypothetical protein